VVTVTDTVWMINPSGQNKGPLHWTRYEAVPRFDAVGTAAFECAFTDAHARALQPGWRLVLRDGATTVIGGMVTDAEFVQEDNGGRPRQRLRYTIEDDNRWIAGRHARPVPGAALSAQTSPYDVRTGVASTVMAAYVNANAGPGALTARRVPGLTLAADPGIGATVTGRARFDPLPDLLGRLAISGAVDGVHLGWRVNTGLSLAKTFEVYRPEDLRGPARFGLALGNLKSVTYRLTAPRATHVVGGGRGELEARSFEEVGVTETATLWGRMEDFYDYSAAADDDGGAELRQGAGERLVEQAAQQTVEVQPIDSARLVYGRDYGLGALVTVQILPGLTVDEVIREVTIKNDRETGKTVRPRVGSVGAYRTTAAARRARDLAARVRRLERR
jgi:hypothetical protein